MLFVNNGVYVRPTLEKGRGPGLLASPLPFYSKCPLPPLPPPPHTHTQTNTGRTCPNNTKLLLIYVGVKGLNVRINDKVTFPPMSL